jgi:hypothetical protein
VSYRADYSGTSGTELEAQKCPLPAELLGSPGPPLSSSSLSRDSKSRSPGDSVNGDSCEAVGPGNCQRVMACHAHQSGEAESALIGVLFCFSRCLGGFLLVLARLPGFCFGDRRLTGKPQSFSIKIVSDQPDFGSDQVILSSCHRAISDKQSWRSSQKWHCQHCRICNLQSTFLQRRTDPPPAPANT